MNKYAPLTKRQMTFIDFAVANGHDGDTLTRADVVALYNDGQNGIKWPRWITESADRRLGRGMYHVPEIASTANGSDPAMPVDETACVEAVEEPVVTGTTSTAVAV